MTVYIENPVQTSNLPNRIRLQPDDIINLRSGEKLMVEKILGEGGFGSVYCVNNNSQNKKYALKVLDLWRMKPSDHLEFTQRFKEGYKAGLIKSDFLVNNYNFGYVDSNPFLVMDYCKNGNLTNQKNNFYNLDKAETLIYQLTKGLNALHKNGFIHRDLKPENILFDDCMNARLCDFDITGRFGVQNCRITRPNLFGNVNEVWGTILYAAPEQLDHSKAFKFLGPQMDFYALGVTMYEILSGGKLPFGTFDDYQRSPTDYYKRIKNSDYVPIQKWRPTISNKWINFFESALQPNPLKRPSSGDEVLNVLGIYDQQQQVKKPLDFKAKDLLIFKSGEEIGKQIDLKELLRNKRKNILKVGWSYPESQNDIDIKETETAYVSKKHATIELNGDRFLIRDGQWVDNGDNGHWKYSLNGVYINSKKLKSESFYILQVGDIISIGNTNLMFS